MPDTTSPAWTSFPLRPAQIGSTNHVFQPNAMATAAPERLAFSEVTAGRDDASFLTGRTYLTARFGGFS